MRLCFRCQQIKPLEDFSKSRVKKGGLQERCKVCCKEHYHSTGYAVRQRELDLKKKYNITPKVYTDMVLIQGSCCAVCKTSSLKLHVDHNHTTGKVRGLLCSNCNRGIGLLKDNTQILLNAAEYINNDGI
jgi:hypothetical protein